VFDITKIIRNHFFEISYVAIMVVNDNWEN